MEKTEKYDALKLENQLCFPLYACARKVTNLYAPYFKPYGITYTQYIVLMVLWEHDGISVGELGEKLYLDTGTLTPLLKRMADEGLLLRTRSKADERIVTLTLTQKGHDLRECLKDIPQKIGSCVKLEHSEAQTLYQLLYKVMDNIHPD